MRDSMGKKRSKQEILDAAGVETEKQLWLKCQFSFTTFATAVIGLELADFHSEWVDLMKKHDKVCLIAATGHGKTEVMGVAYSLWKATTTPNYEILIVSNSQEQANNILERQKEALKGNEILEEYIPSGSLKDRRGYWSSTKYKLKNGSRVIAKTMNKNVRSEHVNLIIADEIAQYEDKDTFYTDLMSRVRAKRGKFVGISTPISKLDLTQELKKKAEENNTWVVKEYPALDEDGNILWERGENDNWGFDREYLEQARKDDPIAFEKDYLLKPVSSAEQAFPAEWIADALARGSELRFDHRDNGKHHHVGADFQVSQSEYGQSYSVFLAARREGDNIIIKDMDRHKGLGISTQQNRLANFCKKHRATKANIDASTIGKGFEQDLRKRGIPVRGYDLVRKHRTDILQNLQKTLHPDNPIKITIPNNPNHSRTRKLAKIISKESQNIGYHEDESGKPNYTKKGVTDDTIFALALAIYNLTQRNPHKTPIMGITIKDINPTQETTQQNKENQIQGLKNGKLINKNPH